MTAEPLPRRSGELATRATKRMEAEHAWFRLLSADDRSWVSLIAQTGISALLSWYDDGAPAHSLTGAAFATAPQSLASRISLRHALELTRTAIATVEDTVPDLVGEGEQAQLREAIVRYSREVAFTAAEIYARAAERRGGWDARLESLVVNSVVRGESDDTLLARSSELGWDEAGPLAVVAGSLPDGDAAVTLTALREAAHRQDREVLAAVQGQRLVTILAGVRDPITDAAELAAYFGSGPVVVGPVVPHLFAAGRSARAALSGCDAAWGWTNVPRPVAADDLLPERALLGEQPARRMLVDRVYQPLAEHPSALLETVQAYLDHGTALEATAREMFLHPNTVRYRLRRAAETVGLDPHIPRDAWVLQVALTIGRIGRYTRSERRRQAT